MIKCSKFLLTDQMQFNLSKEETHMGETSFTTNSIPSPKQAVPESRYSVKYLDA